MEFVVANYEGPGAAAPPIGGDGVIQPVEQLVAANVDVDTDMLGMLLRNREIDPWSISIMNFISTYTRVPRRIVSVIFDVAVAAFLCIYRNLVVTPLRIYYYIGPVWKNKAPEDICAEMNPGISSKGFVRNEHTMALCKESLDRQFTSWNAEVITIIYFAMLAITVMYLIYHCFFIKPIAKCVCRCIGKCFCKIKAII
jgi:hypothetical protein